MILWVKVKDLSVNIVTKKDKNIINLVNLLNRINELLNQKNLKNKLIINKTILLKMLAILKHRNLIMITYL